MNPDFLDTDSLDELRKSMEPLTISQLADLIQKADRVKKWAEVELQVKVKLRSLELAIKDGHGSHGAEVLGKMPLIDVLRICVPNNIVTTFCYQGLE